MSEDLDPMGALIVRESPSSSSLTDGAQIGIVIIITWSRTIYRQFTYLAGIVAPRDALQLVMYQMLVFHEEIDKIKSIVVFHVRRRVSLCSG